MTARLAVKWMRLTSWLLAAGVPLGIRKSNVARIRRAKRARDRTGNGTVIGTFECANHRRRRKLVMSNKFASTATTRAEGMGLEPTTGCPAPEFQSGR